MNYGFIHEQPKQEDFLFGDASIDAPVLQPDANWTEYLPKPEQQNLNAVETYACASFGTFNCIEILLRRLYNFQDNFSDRYLAKISGTQFQHGNSPHTVAETIRHYGAVDEDSWPFTADVTTFDRFYTTPPEVLVDQAARFNQHYTLKHDYVPNDPTSMMEALKYSPLGMSVYAWTPLENGLYAAGNGADNHWVCVYGYEKDIHWKVFDSYDNTLKMVEWKHRPLTVKRYHIELAPQTMNWLETIRKALLEFLASFKKPTPLTVATATPIPAYDFSTPEAARHSVRVICDELGLSLSEKNLICQVIRAESGFKNTAKLENKKNGKVWSTDWGICQINDYYHVGPGKRFPSVKYILENPDKAVTWMIAMFKQGKLSMWVAYSSGSYKKYAP